MGGCFPWPKECSLFLPGVSREVKNCKAACCSPVITACRSGLLKEYPYDPNSRLKGRVMVPLAKEQTSKWGTSNISVRTSKNLVIRLREGCSGRF